MKGSTSLTTKDNLNTKGYPLLQGEARSIGRVGGWKGILGRRNNFSEGVEFGICKYSVSVMCEKGLS